jgi:hypothetical protein
MPVLDHRINYENPCPDPDVPSLIGSLYMRNGRFYIRIPHKPAHGNTMQYGDVEISPSQDLIAIAAKLLLEK